MELKANKVTKDEVSQLQKNGKLTFLKLSFLKTVKKI